MTRQHLNRPPLQFTPPADGGATPGCICSACEQARRKAATAAPGRTPEAALPVHTPEQGRPISTRTSPAGKS